MIEKAKVTNNHAIMTVPDGLIPYRFRKTANDHSTNARHLKWLQDLQRNQIRKLKEKHKKTIRKRYHKSLLPLAQLVHDILYMWAHTGLALRLLSAQAFG